MDLKEVYPQFDVVKKWYVKSSDDPLKLYLVEKTIDGNMRCSCTNWIMNQRQVGYECKHIKRVRQKELL